MIRMERKPPFPPLKMMAISTTATTAAQPAAISSNLPVSGCATNTITAVMQKMINAVLRFEVRTKTASAWIPPAASGMMQPLSSRKDLPMRMISMGTNTMTATLQASDGWKRKGPRLSQRFAPLIRRPRGVKRTTNRRNSDRT